MRKSLKTIPALLLAGIFLCVSCLPAQAQPLESAPPIQLTAPSYLLADAETGAIIFEKGADTPRQVASLTKLMTVLLVLERLDRGEISLDDTVAVSKTAASAPGSTALLDAGASYRVEDLLRSAIVASGNDSATALAEHLAGSEEAFVALMNRKAGELGMKHTHFANCTGLTSPEHYSSAADLAVLLQAALNNETFRTVFTTGQYTSSVTAQHPKGLYMASTLLSRLDGGEVTGGQILGGKTGYTDAAGLCLASLAVVNGKEYILVTLGAPGNHATEQTNIMDAVQVYRRLEKKK